MLVLITGTALYSIFYKSILGPSAYGKVIYFFLLEVSVHLKRFKFILRIFYNFKENNFKYFTNISALCSIFFKIKYFFIFIFKLIAKFTNIEILSS